METIAIDKCPMTLLQSTSQPPTNNILNAYEMKKQPELIKYYHAAAGFPTQPTWIAAIKNGHYKSWKGLTAAAVRRSYPESIETWRDHGQKIKMNLRSTKKALEEEEAQYIAQNQHPLDISNNKGQKQVLASNGHIYNKLNYVLFRRMEGESVTTNNWSPISTNKREEYFEQPSAPLTRERTNDVYSVVYNLQDEVERKMYTDQTGKFPTKSYRGMQYIMVLIEMDSNSILVETMRNL